MAKGKNPKKEPKKQPKGHGNHHPTDYQRERAKANAETPRRKDKCAQG